MTSLYWPRRPEVQKSQQCGEAERLEDWGRDHHRVQGGATITECSRYRSGRSPNWLKFKNPEAPAVKREAEVGQDELRGQLPVVADWLRTAAQA
jgi:hypothetical protein